MKRKVFRNGPSLVVTLPSKWVKEYGINYGDELQFTERDGQLLLSTTNEAVNSRKEIDLSDIDRTFCQLYLRSIYKNGHNDILANFKNTTTTHLRTNRELPTTSVIHEKLDKLIGIEAIQQGKNSIHIKDITRSNPEEFGTIVKKIFFQLLDYTEDFFTSLKENNIDLVMLEEKHDTIEKFIAYSLRLLNKKGSKENNLFHILESFEFIIDIIKYCARDADRFDIVLQEKSKHYLDEVYQLIRAYHDLYYNFNNHQIRRFNEKRTELKQLIQELAGNLSSKEIMVLKDMEHLVSILFLLVESRMGME